MARIAGVDIPREKRLEISLTYIYGIGRSTSQMICEQTNLPRDTRARKRVHDAGTAATRRGRESERDRRSASNCGSC